MYNRYENQAIEVYDQYEDVADLNTDLQFSPVVNKILLVLWGLICLCGFGIIFVLKLPIIGLAVIGIPTLIGMVIKPTFSLCVMMLALPTGAGVGIGQVFSLDRGVGIAVALAFLLNIMITRPKLKMNGILWVLLFYTIWICLDSLTSPFLKPELIRAFTQIQLFALILIVYWIIETNGPATFIVILQSYVIGTLGTIALTFITGAAVRSVEEGVQERYSASLGNEINANLLAVIVSMAFLTAIYLLLRDKRFIWRMFYAVAILFLPIMLIKMSSRGGSIALAVAVMSPLLFLRQVLRKPALFISTLLFIFFMAFFLAVFLKSNESASRAQQRFSDLYYAEQSTSYRWYLNVLAIKSSLKNPLGKTHYGWIGSSEVEHFPHSDLFYILAAYGFPGAILFTMFLINVIRRIKRMPFCKEKIYARTILIFFLVVGLAHTFVYQKVFWVFFAIVMASEKKSYSFLSKEIINGPDETITENCFENQDIAIS